MLWDGRKVIAWCNPKTAPKDGPNEFRNLIILDALQRMIRLGDIDLILIEDYAFSRQAQTRLGELGGVIKSFLYNRCYPFTIISNTAIKKFATGNHQAKKPEMLEAARKFWLKCPNHDVADALHLARYAHVGQEELISLAKEHEFPADVGDTVRGLHGPASSSIHIIKYKPKSSNRPGDS